MLSGSWVGFPVEDQSDCAEGHSRFSRPKKSASRGAMPSAGAVSLRRLRSDGISFCSSGADDLIGGAEDSLRALFRYCFGIQTTATVDPILNIPTTEGGSLKP